MGKKQRPAQGGEDAQAQVVQNRDTLQRLNFLLQASTYLAHASASAASSSASTSNKPNASTQDPARSESSKKPARPHDRRTLSLHDLSRAYAHDIRAVGARTVTRIDPAVKRAICKGCSTVLLPGRTSQVRVLPSHPHRHVVRTKCKACGAARVIPCPPREGVEEEKGVEVEGEATTGDAGEKGVSEGKQQPRVKRRGPRGKIPFHERPDHIVFRGRERLHPAQAPAPQIKEDPPSL